MSRLPHVALLVAAVARPATLPCQSRASQLIDSARAQLAARNGDSAAALLRAALDTAVHATPAERQNALVWEGIVQFLQGDEPLARATLREALALDTTLKVGGLDRLAPGLAEMFQQEKEAAIRKGFVYLAGHVDQPPVRLSAPQVTYPPSLLPRHVQGTVEVAAIIDTAGRVETTMLEVLSTPDSGLIEPVKQMMLASRFAPGRLKGATVRVMIQLAVEVRPPRLSATELVTTARAQLAAHRTDSAVTLLAIALDSSVTHPTEGERAYALLVRGVAASAAGRDSAARADFAAGLTLCQDLTARGVDLAPVLRRLGDSIRIGRRKPKADMPAPRALGTVDEPPVLASHPAIRYPPELEALRVGGTVIVEAQLDTAGRVEPASVRIVESPNHAFDEEVRRVVRRSIYRPARSRGRSVRMVIRQAITFVNY